MKRDKQKWIDHLQEQVNAEKEKTAGYEQLAKLHSAYISILLRKLGATASDNAATITNAEVTEALAKHETRATMDAEGNIKLYSVDVE